MTATSASTDARRDAAHARSRARPALRGALVAVACMAALAGCGGDAPTASGTAAPGGTSGSAAQLRVTDWPLPALQPGSAFPDLAATPDGRLLLLWTNAPRGRRPALQFSAWDPGQQRWQSAPVTIAVGNSFFVNWADTPHIMATADGALWVHWLQKHGDTPGAYDILLATSRNGGMRWSPPVMPHDDGTASEHGFVSMWPDGASAVGVAWLDGRATGGAGHAGHEGGHGADTPAAGAMTLRSATVEPTQGRTGDAELDARVCDCCQTGAALTTRGPLVAYRGRSAEEIRDIHVVRRENGAWTAPVRVHADDWKMPACPVNGPAIDATGNAAVVAWYTVAGDTPLVRAARSDDAGGSFAAPVEIDRGGAVQGRVDIALDGNDAWVLWLREEGEGQTLWLSRRSADLATERQRLQVATLAGRGRGTGFPKLVVRDGAAHVVWTDIVDGATVLKGARVMR